MKLGCSSTGRLRVCLYKNGTKKNREVHQLVAIAFLNHTQSGHTRVVDHIDGDFLNNNVENLRIVTQRENSSTCFRSDRNLMASKFPGVHMSSKKKMWRSIIRVDGRGIHLGYYSDELDAANAYSNAVKSLENGTLKEYLKFIAFSSSSKYRNVSWSKAAKKWHAYDRLNGKRVYIGIFSNEIDAFDAVADFQIKNYL